MNLSINSYYNFSVYANSVLGAEYRNVKLVSVMNYQTAVKFSNVTLTHKQVYPYLPEGTPQDLTKYTYYLFKNKEVDLVLADVWIVESSIEIAQGMNYYLELKNISSSKMAMVRDQLKLLGITFTVN